MKLHSQIEINAPVETVWNILMDFESYAKWNPFIFSISGSGEPGSKLNVRMDSMNFNPIVTEFIEYSSFEWNGKLFIRGLFEGRHRFELIKSGVNKCLFIQSEIFSGILVPLFKAKLSDQTQASFEEMNLAIKKRAQEKFVLEGIEVFKS